MGILFEQDMQYEGSSKHSVDGRIQKGIQRILKERGLWPDFGLSLNDARKPSTISTRFFSTTNVAT